MPADPSGPTKPTGPGRFAKGEYEQGQDPEEAASHRSLLRSSARNLPRVGRIDLGELRQPSGKLVRVRAVEGDLDMRHVADDEFEIGGPPHSAVRVVAGG